MQDCKTAGQRQVEEMKRFAMDFPVRVNQMLEEGKKSWDRYEIP
jgi:hypothetical protein